MGKEGKGWESLLEGIILWAIKLGYNIMELPP
jgi:hypothetical protein